MLNSILTEWASLIFRWLHVVAAIGWIGSSFYFIHLDLSLKPRKELPEGVYGEAWQVHGAGQDARRAHLVLLGSLCDMAVRLRPRHHRLLSRCRPVPGR